ncbi:hypothetical protein Ahia01_000272100, partial [Argonauta hians]
LIHSPIGQSSQIYSPNKIYLIYSTITNSKENTYLTIMIKGFYFVSCVILIVYCIDVGVSATSFSDVLTGNGYCEKAHQMSIRLHDFLGCKGGPANYVTVPMMTFLVLLQLLGMYLSKFL